MNDLSGIDLHVLATISGKYWAGAQVNQGLKIDHSPLLPRRDQSRTQQRISLDSCGVKLQSAASQLASLNQWRG